VSAPAAAIPLAIASPMPRLAPATSAFFPASQNIEGKSIRTDLRDRRLRCAQSAIDRKYRTMNERRLRGGQIQGQICYLFGPAHAPDRLPPMQFCTDFFFLVSMVFLKILFNERRIHCPGADAISSQLDGVINSQLPCDSDNRALCRAICKTPFDSHQSGNGTYVNDCAVGVDQERYRGPGHEEHTIHVHAKQPSKIV